MRSLRPLNCVPLFVDPVHPTYAYPCLLRLLVSDPHPRPQMTLCTAFAFPAVAGSVFLLEAFQQWLLGSTGAVPARILLLLLAMLLFVQTPLVFLGSFYGFKKEQPPQVGIETT